MDEKEWEAYFMSGEAFVVHERMDDGTVGKEVLGTFYIKPNFPGRSSHVSFAFYLFIYFLSAFVFFLLRFLIDYTRFATVDS
jgi:hypothetical protein